MRKHNKIHVVYFGESDNNGYITGDYRISEGRTNQDSPVWRVWKYTNKNQELPFELIAPVNETLHHALIWISNHDERVRSAIYKIKGVCPDVIVEWNEFNENYVLKGAWYKIAKYITSNSLYFFVELNGDFSFYKVGQYTKVNKEERGIFMRFQYGL